MITIEKTKVMNLEAAVRGMRNPMNSWANSDSYYNENGEYVLGEADIKRAHALSVSGSDHRKYLRMIFVSVDITAPLYWWARWQTPAPPCIKFIQSLSPARISAATE